MWERRAKELNSFFSVEWMGSNKYILFALGLLTGAFVSDIQ